MSRGCVRPARSSSARPTHPNSAMPPSRATTFSEPRAIPGTQNARRAVPAGARRQQLAGGLVPLATASDGGGSIRIPAAYTGLYGLKTSFGRVPIGPRAIQPWMNISVYGPLTRTVRDAALYLDQVAGPHGSDPMSLPPPTESYIEGARPSPTPGCVSPTTARSAKRMSQRTSCAKLRPALQVFRDLGHTVIDNDDTIPQTAEHWIRMFGFQSLALLWEEYSDRHQRVHPPTSSGCLDASLDVNATDFRAFYQRTRTDPALDLGALRAV